MTDAEILALFALAGLVRQAHTEDSQPFRDSVDRAAGRLTDAEVRAAYRQTP